MGQEHQSFSATYQPISLVTQVTACPLTVVHPLIREIYWRGDPAGFSISLGSLLLKPQSFTWTVLVCSEEEFDLGASWACILSFHSKSLGANRNRKVLRLAVSFRSIDFEWSGGWAFTLPLHSYTLLQSCGLILVLAISEGLRSQTLITYPVDRG